MALLAKVHDLKRKLQDAISDVPDNLIGMVVALGILTVIGLGILIAMGYFATNP
jgi:hypothetical protein